MIKYFILLLLSIVCINSHAQNRYFGVKSGANFSNVSASELFNQSTPKPGFSGGLLFETEFAEWYTFAAQIIFSENGFLDEIILTDEQGNIIQNELMMRFDYNYLSVPLTVGYTFGQNFFVVVKVGVQPSILIEAKTYIPRIEANDLVLESETHYVTDKVSKFDIAGVMGVDINYKFYNRFILFTSIEGKYSITKFSNKNYFLQYDLRHYGVTLSLGVKYIIQPNL